MAIDFFYKIGKITIQKISLLAWCSLINTSPCHGEDHGFESRSERIG